MDGMKNSFDNNKEVLDDFVTTSDVSSSNKIGENYDSANMSKKREKKIVL